MSIAAISEIRDRLQQGASLDDVLRDYAWQADRAALARCAALHQFDHNMYEAVVKPQLPSGSATTFEQLDEFSAVEAVPRAEGWRRIGETHRDALLTEFWPAGMQSISTSDDIPVPLRELSLAAYDYMIKRRVGNEFDRLFVLIAADPVKARSYFQRKFRDADRKFDRAACYGLLEVLEERIAFLSEPLRELHKVCQAYLSARGFWSIAQYQTANYLERQPLLESVEDFFKPTDRWILQVYAPGGMGKTMFIRWLIARRAVPRPHQYPCALIDFDIADPSRASQWPWLLYLKICDQLDQQLPNKPFQDMMADYRSYLAELDRTTHNQELLTADQSMEKSIRQRMLRSFGDAKLKKPVLVVLDTMEEVLLRADADVNAIVEPLLKLHTDLPNLRLVLAGRYALHRKSKKMRRFLRDRQRVIRVGLFKKSESVEYLQSCRGLEPDNRTDLIIRLAKGNPFKLSIYADLLQLSPDVTVSDLDSYRDVDMAYLLDRVVDRIEDPQVCWLLRYGVVPRQLSIGFVRDVMATFLPPAMAGDKKQDDPDLGFPNRGKSGSETFRGDLLNSANSQVDVEALWKKLTNYAGGHSWVTLVAGTDDVLTFHRDVVNPMRRLLEKNPVFFDLHRAAFDYYCAQSDEDPDAYTWRREAVYHRFQMDGAAAGKFWKQQMRSADNNILLRYELSLELIGSEYVDERGRALRRGDRNQIVSDGLLVEARLELARSALALAENSGSADRVRFLKSARKALSPGSRSAEQQMPYWHRNLLGARLDCNEGRARSGLNKLSRLHRRELQAGGIDASPLDRFEYQTTRAKLLSVSDSPDAETALAEAIDEGTKLGALEAVRDLHIYLARALRARGQLHDSVVSFEKAREIEKTASIPTDAIASNLLDEAEASIAVGKLDHADELLKKARRKEFRDSVDNLHQQRLLTASLAQLRRRPDECLRIASKTISALKRRRSYDAEYLGFAHEIGAAAYADLLRFSESFAFWEKAAVNYQKAGNRQAANRCTLRLRELECWRLNKVEFLPVTLLQRMAVADDMPLELQGRAELLIIARNCHSGNLKTALERTLKLVVRVRDQGDPLIRSRTGLDLVCIWGDDAPPEVITLVDTVADELGALSDWLPLRDVLERCPYQSALRNLELAHRLVPNTDLRTCRLVEAEVAAHLYRLSGDPEFISAIAQRAFRPDTDDPFAIYALLNAIDRAAVPIQMPEDWSDWLRSLLKTYSGWRVLCAHAVIAQTRRLAINPSEHSAGQMISAVMIGILEDPQDNKDQPLPQDAGLVKRLKNSLVVVSRNFGRILARGFYESRLEENIRQPQRLLRVINSYLEKNPSGKESRAKREKFFESRALMRTLQVSASILIDGDNEGWTRGLEALKKEMRPHRDGKNFDRAMDVWQSGVTERTPEPQASVPAPASVPMHRGGSADWSSTLSVQEDTVESISFCSSLDFEQIRAVDSSEILVRDLCELVANPDWYKITETIVELSRSSGGTELGASLGKFLFSGDSWRAFAKLLETREGPVRLSLNVEQPIIHALPWELATNGSSLTGLMEGNPRITTFRQMPKGDWLDSDRQKKRRALIIKQSEHSQLAGERGSSTEGFDLRNLYHFAKYDVMTLDDPNSDMIAESLAAAEPDIVHIEAPLFASTDGEGLYLHLASREGTAEPISAVYLAKLLQIVNLPAVVVDVPAPSGPSEAIRQLMMRNLFIAVLGREAPFPAVIGIGPSSRSTRFETWDALGRGLYDNENLEDLFRAIFDAEMQEREFVTAPALAISDPARLANPL